MSTLATPPLGRDTDTRTKGTEPPFDHWEHDNTGLVHVLWQARREGLSLDGDEDEIASLILNSRWAAAYQAAGQTHSPDHTEGPR